MIAGSMLWLAPSSAAQSSSFRNAPPSAAEMKNPYTSASAAAAGKKLYAQNCAQCHGANLQGMGPAPALDSAPVKKAKPGELFWFVTKGKLESGMPSWAQPAAATALADRDFSGVAGQNEGRSAVSVLLRKSFTTEDTEHPESWFLSGFLRDLGGLRG